MGKIVFLGTGASGGTPGTGKSNRRESSLLLKDRLSILLDVTRHFSKQAECLERIDCILLTHGHADACGGIGQLRTWLKGKNAQAVPVYAHPQTIEVIRNKHKLLDHCRFHAIREGQTVKLDSWEITPLLVPHSRDPRFPAFAWKLRKDETIVYASDIAELTEEFKSFCQGANLLIIDGATWRRKIFSHLRVDRDLPQVCTWKTGKIILTQIGRSAPPHEVFTNEIRTICPRAVPAYDGLEQHITS